MDSDTLITMWAEMLNIAIAYQSVAKVSYMPVPRELQRLILRYVLDIDLQHIFPVLKR
jgi:hypothetical protein